MRKRCSALACLLAICMAATAVPTDVLAQEMQNQEDSQEVVADEQKELETLGNTVDEQTQADSEKKPDVEPEKVSEGNEQEKVIEEKDTETAKEEVLEEAVPEEKDSEPVEELEEEQEQIEIDPQDPGKYRLTGRGTGEFASTEINAQALSPQKKYSDCILQKGIDVSYHNGTINWKKVKEDGIDFAIIRVAYRGYENGKLAMDVKALENMRKANEEEIPIGVYIFSQATTAKEAAQEADYIVSKIRGYKIDLPVVLDFEYVAVGVGRLYKAKLSKSQATSVCTSFCKRVKALGYTPMVYASKSMYEDKIYAADVSQEYPIWMAHYTKSTNYAGEYEYWQYSSKGDVKGIDDHYVDFNYRYLNTLRITGKNTSSISMKWDTWQGASGYDVYRKDGSGNYSLLKSKVSGTSFTDTALSPGKDYSYKIYPIVNGVRKECIGFNTGITTLKSTSASGKAAAFDKVKIKWSKVAGAASYYVQRYDSSKKTYSNIKKVSGKTYSYTDGSKNASTTYQYRVRPYKVVFNGRTYGSSKIVKVKTKGKVKGKTKSKKINLRKKASKSSKNLGTIKKKGSKVTVIGSSGSWYKISVKIKGKNRTGYIKKSNIKLIK